MINMLLVVTPCRLWEFALLPRRVRGTLQLILACFLLGTLDIEDELDPFFTLGRPLLYSRKSPTLLSVKGSGRLPFVVPLQASFSFCSVENGMAGIAYPILNGFLIGFLSLQ